MEPKKEETKPVAKVEPALLKKTLKAIADLKDANEKHESLLDREEKLKATEALGGMSEAGEAPLAPTEETPQDYAKKVMAGEVGD